MDSSNDRQIPSKVVYNAVPTPTWISLMGTTDTFGKETKKNNENQNHKQKQLPPTKTKTKPKNIYKSIYIE